MGSTQFQASFAAADITPPIGTAKIGWLRSIVPTEVLDPLRARVCLIEAANGRLAIIALDTLSVSRSHVDQIRRSIEAKTPFGGSSVMVAATHNHAGPALVRLGDVPVDESYRDTVTEAVVGAVSAATAKLAPAEIGVGRHVETSVPHNRRVVLRDGTVETHGSLQDDEALYVEGPIDPILTTIGFRSERGTWLGAIVNFACHPTHHGDDAAFSAGYPGVLSNQLEAAGIPNTLFLNGAQGNVHWIDPADPTQVRSMEAIGMALAKASLRSIEKMTWRPDLHLRTAAVNLDLPFRRPTADDVAGTVRGAQRLVDPTVYDRVMPQVLAELARDGRQRAEIQAIVLNDHALVGVPAELFVELGLQIKERAFPVRALVVGLANGMVGYVPHHAAFSRGGYETTFGDGSKLAPEAGELIVEGALAALSEAMHEPVGSA